MTEMRTGSTACEPGWNVEYSGYLVSTPKNAYRGEYVCVDSDAEVTRLGDNDDNTNNAQMAPVQLEWDDAGGNEMSRYELHGELGCAVCSKPAASVAACEAAEAPSRGRMSCSNGAQDGSVCSYSCGVGFVLSGASSRRCLATSQWDVDVPTCEAATVAATSLSVHWGSGGLCGARDAVVREQDDWVELQCGGQWGELPVPGAGSGGDDDQHWRRVEQCGGVAGGVCVGIRARVERF